MNKKIFLAMAIVFIIAFIGTASAQTIDIPTCNSSVYSLGSTYRLVCVITEENPSGNRYYDYSDLYNLFNKVKIFNGSNPKKISEVDFRISPGSGGADTVYIDNRNNAFDGKNFGIPSGMFPAGEEPKFNLEILNEGMLDFWYAAGSDKLAAIKVDNLDIEGGHISSLGSPIIVNENFTAIGSPGHVWSEGSETIDLLDDCSSTPITVGGDFTLDHANIYRNRNNINVGGTFRMKNKSELQDKGCGNPISIIAGDEFSLESGSTLHQDDHSWTISEIKAPKVSFIGVNTNQSGNEWGLSTTIKANEINFNNAHFISAGRGEDNLALQPYSGAKIENLTLLNDSEIEVASAAINVNNLSMDSSSIKGSGNVSINLLSKPAYSGSMIYSGQYSKTISLKYDFEGTATLPILKALTDSTSSNPDSIIVTGPSSKNLDLTVNQEINADGWTHGCGRFGGKIQLSNFNNITITSAIHANAGDSACHGSFIKGGSITIAAPQGKIRMTGNGVVSASGGSEDSGTCVGPHGTIDMTAGEIEASYSSSSGKAMFDSSCGSANDGYGTAQGMAHVTIHNSGNLTLSKAIAKLDNSPMSGSGAENVSLDGSQVYGLSGDLIASDTIQVTDSHINKSQIGAVKANKLIVSTGSGIDAIGGNITTKDYTKISSSTINFDGSADQTINPHSDATSTLYQTENNGRTFNSSNSKYYSNGNKNVIIKDSDDLTVYSYNDDFGTLTTSTPTFNIANDPTSCNTNVKNCNIAGSGTVRVTWFNTDPDCSATDPTQFVKSQDLRCVGSGGGGASASCASIVANASGLNVDVTALFNLGSAPSTDYTKSLDCGGGTDSGVSFDATGKLTGKCKYSGSGTFNLVASIFKGTENVYCQAQTVVCNGSTCTVGGGDGGGHDPINATFFVNAFILDNSAPKKPVSGATVKITLNDSDGNPVGCSTSFTANAQGLIKDGSFNCDLLTNSTYSAIVKITDSTGHSNTFGTTVKT